MASFFNNLGQRIDQGIAGLYNRDQIVDLENQYGNQYGLQQTGTGIGSDARHMSAMNNLSNTLSKSGLGIAMGLPSEFAGDIGAFGAGLINEIPALARGFNRQNFGEIGEDIVANFKGTFGTPNSATAEDIYSQVFSGAVPQRVASSNNPAYGAAQASDLTDLERDFPGMSTGDIIDSMNNRQAVNRFSGMGQMGPNKSNMNAPQIASPRTVIDQNRIPGRIQEAVEPSTRFRDASNMAEYLQGNPQIMDNIQNTIGLGIDKFKSGLGSIKDFAMDKGNKGRNLIGSAGAMALGLPGMVGSGLMSLLSNLRDPNAPSYQTRSPNIDYSNLNTTNLNDFYDSNPNSKNFGTTRFDRAKPGSFGSYRNLADYFNRNKTAAAAMTTKKAKKEAAMQQQIKDAAAERASYMARAQRIADSRDSGQGNTVTGFGKSGLGRDPNDRMADGGRVGLASMFTRKR
jgi:hypothetical protein